MAKTYLVGGAVRDLRLGLEPKERDYVVVGSTPDAMLSQGFQRVGKDFPVFIHPKTGEEYALARTERKVGEGYLGFECVFDPDTTLEDDLYRRDLTINAMAMDGDVLIDPYGGESDLKLRVLRHVSDAFSEDPLRVLRIARFQATFPDFHIADETWEKLREMVKDQDFLTLTKERLLLEMRKSLKTKAPWKFFETLAVLDALGVFFIDANIQDLTHALKALKHTSMQHRWLACLWRQNTTVLAVYPLTLEEKYWIKVAPILNHPCQELASFFAKTDVIRRRSLGRVVFEVYDDLWGSQYASSLDEVFSAYDAISFPDHLKNAPGEEIRMFYQSQLQNIMKRFFECP